MSYDSLLGAIGCASYRDENVWTLNQISLFYPGGATIMFVRPEYTRQSSDLRASISSLALQSPA